MKLKTIVWPVIGLSAVGFSVWLLYGELRGMSLAELGGSLAAIPLQLWVLAALSSVVAYMALAGYDHIALLHLERKVPFSFITVCSFTTYALSHNIGGSVLSGAVVRYRAYATKGLSGPEVGILVAVCWFTFVLAMIFIGSLLLVLLPEFANRFVGLLPVEASAATGVIGLAFVALYVFGSALKLRPLGIGPVHLHYPRLSIVLAQLTVGPAEILAAAAILFFALPDAGNPGYLVVLGIFVVAFSV